MFYYSHNYRRTMYKIRLNTREKEVEVEKAPRKGKTEKSTKRSVSPSMRLK